MRTIASLALAMAVTAVSGPEGRQQTVRPAPQSPAPAGAVQRPASDVFDADQQRVAPFKVFDNLYYVGISWVGSWLITTDQGLILIDSVFEPHVAGLTANIEALGFKPSDIKYVLVTHAHFDHIGGAASLQEAYGATVGMLEADWQHLATGGEATEGVRHPRRDLVLKDGDIVRLGSTTLQCHAFPGHTPGVLSIITTAYDGGKPVTVFVGGAVGGSRTVPTTREQTLANLARLEKIDSQVSLPMHPHVLSDFWDRVERLRRRKPGEPHPFVSADAWKNQGR
jgi:metallo-beta-lactamase class B